MDLFRGLAESAKQEVARTIRILAIRIALGTLAFLAALAAIIFFFAALMTALAERFGELIAELTVGGVFAVFALILFAIVTQIGRRGRSSAATRSEEAARAAPLPAAIAAFAYGFARGVMRKRQASSGSHRGRRAEE